jgi:hypothetical protein
MKKVYEQVYFFSTWTVRFKPELWMVGGKLTRTNNALERFNSGLKRKMCSNQHYWTFFTKLHGVVSMAIQKQISDERRGVLTTDRSLLSAPLKFARDALSKGNCNVDDFLFFMASQPRKKNRRKK